MPVINPTTPTKAAPPVGVSVEVTPEGDFYATIAGERRVNDMTWTQQALTQLVERFSAKQKGAPTA